VISAARDCTAHTMDELTVDGYRLSGLRFDGDLSAPAKQPITANR